MTIGLTREQEIELMKNAEHRAKERSERQMRDPALRSVLRSARALLDALKDEGEGRG